MWGEGGGRGLVENVIWGEKWLKTSEYCHIGERGSKIAKKKTLRFNDKRMCEEYLLPFNFFG